MHANNQENHARRRSGLVLALVGLLSVTGLVIGPTTPASAQADAPSWSYTGNLNDGRHGHTATLLSDGTVLVAGGSNATGVLASAELYDPNTGMWSITGSLNVARLIHTATLLQDGKILVPGGDSRSSSITNTAELYDPATGIWITAGALNIKRYFHTATLLQAGKVLVAGGCLDGDCDVPLASAELYDPNTGAWSVTGRANALRDEHTATLLPDGQVLVAGGGRQFQNLHTNELYNPATETWSFTRDLIRHTNHTATLLSNGKVLVAGGNTYDGAFRTVNDAEIYDPATGKWKPTASLNAERAGHTATLLSDGKVLVVGGHNNDRSAELYDPEMPGPTPTAPRIIMASVSGKKLFITGENFDDGAVILLNGEEQKTKQPAANPQTTLIGKKAGKKIKPGDRVQVRNPDGTLSEEFIFVGS